MKNVYLKLHRNLISLLTNFKFYTLVSTFIISNKHELIKRYDEFTFYHHFFNVIEYSININEM
jgi:hypothetical protein